LILKLSSAKIDSAGSDISLVWRTTEQLDNFFYGELAVGNRPIGRPCLRYKDNIKALLKVGDIVQSWNTLALDRSGWRSCSFMNPNRLEKYERSREKRKL